MKENGRRKLHLMYFINESGSIPTFKSRKWKNRYFVIAFVHTNNPVKLEKVHRKSLFNLNKYHPHIFSESGELKGSNAPPFAKDYLLRRLFQKTDISIGYIVVDNWNIKDSFREVPSRSFNYLVKMMFTSHTLGASDRSLLSLKSDNRNTAIKSLKSLEEYLFQELVLGEEVTYGVDIEYCESSENINIQVADLMANTIHQYYKFCRFSFPNHHDIQGDIDFPNPDVVSYLYGLIKPRLFYNQVFPGKSTPSNVALA